MTRRLRRTVVRSVLLAAAGVLTALSIADPASAHTDLVGSFPDQGSVVPAPVSQVRLVFGESPSSSPLQVVVTAPGGRDVVVGSPRIEGRTVLVAVGPLTETGRYVVSYRVAASDDHPETGGFRFTVGSGRADAARPVASVDPPRATGAFARTDSTAPATGGRWPWIALALVVLGLAISARLSRAVGRRGDDGMREGPRP